MEEESPVIKDFPVSLCEGCLSRSRDRILAIITNDEIRKVYCSIVHEKLHEPGPLMLCWECVGQIQRFLCFRRRCAAAHDALIKYMLNPEKINGLSTLSIVKNEVQINITHSEEFIYEADSTPKHVEKRVDSTLYDKPEFFSTNQEVPQIKTKCSGQEKLENLIHTNLQDSYEVEKTPRTNDRKKETDITFIKIEEDAVYDDYLDDLDTEDQNEQEVSTQKERKEEKIRKRSKKKQAEFNDSDDEPLNIKKRVKTEREGKQKKKIEGTELKRGKREKPAGVVTNARVAKKLQQLNVPEGKLEMVVLSWEEVQAEREAALSSVVFTRHEYRCYECAVGFNHSFKLHNHMRKHDPSAGDMVCNVCKVRCRDAHALCAHKRRHRVRWRCCLCGDTWSRAAVAADHYARAHGAPPPTHTCSVCGHSAPTLGKLRNHIKNHAERQKCDLCGKTFRDRTSLRTHLFIHKGVKEYSCPRCDKKFLFKKAMEVHMVTHDASAHLYCYQCDMNFKNRMSYTQHMKYSLKHIDPAKLKYACQLCDKKFVKATRLEEHNLAVHLKATPIRCTITDCQFACSSRPVLRTHIRMVHRNARALRNHVCHTCGKTYTTKKTLEGHMRSHTGERPFSCTQCPSTFGYEAALYNHNKLVHNKLKTSRRPGNVTQSTHTTTELT
ncbi:uncharacterized protein LOC142985577 isoform X2 [Anticarsia gemmatalis]|uniref:uncharacterized protein LOC142985577 isoform X2 n=1 Tax=Anticarsia gemmatalis TaxID=129554 RepID=UPI003F770B0B